MLMFDRVVAPIASQYISSPKIELISKDAENDHKPVFVFFFFSLQ